MDRVRCPACGRRGFAHFERHVRGDVVTPLFRCDACHHAWRPKPHTVKAVEQRADKRRREREAR